MEIFEPGALEIFFLKLAIFFYDLRQPKRALQEMRYQRNFRTESKLIMRANRKKPVPEDMLEWAEYIKTSTHRLFGTTSATMEQLSGSISRQNLGGSRATFRDRHHQWRIQRDRLIRLDRQNLHGKSARRESRDLEQDIQFTVDLVSNRKVTAIDLVYEFKPEACHAVDFLISKPAVNAFYDKLIPDLLSARSSINIIMYGFRDTKGDPNTTAGRIARILSDKARSGVEVNLLLDGIGSGIFGFRQNANCYNLIQSMIQSGVHCVLNDPWNINDEERLFKLDHRKQFIIDGTIAYVGGMGIEDQFDNNDESKNCHDIMVRLEGKIVHQFQCSFLSSFVYQYVKNNAAARFPLSRSKQVIRDKYFPVTVETTMDVKGVCLQNIPVAHDHQITAKYHKLAAEASQFAYFVNPYCSEDSFVRTLNRWAKAKTRVLDMRPDGVADSHDTEGALLLLPGEIIKDSAGLLKRFELPRLILSGVKIILYSAGFLHAKSAVQDYEKVLIGSCNLDAFSMWRNWESAVFFQNTEFADQILKGIFCHSEEPEKYKVLSSTYDFKWWEKVVCWFLEKIDRFF